MSVRIRGIAKIAAVIFIAIYIIIYHLEPFSDIWNSILIDLFPVITAAVTAALATMIWAGYEPTETPRRIWRFFAIGLWLWVMAEFIWGYLDVSLGEVSISIADAFWVAAYIFFAHALFVQYRLLAGASQRKMWSIVSAAIVILLVLYLVVFRLLTTWVDAESRFEAAVNSFYPIGDLFLAVIAVWLVRHFSGGAFARPWLGLFAFAFTDLLYAWIELSQIYVSNENLTNFLGELFDIAYVGAYLILGLGLLSQWVFLKYGLRAPTQPQ